MKRDVSLLSTIIVLAGFIIGSYIATRFILTDGVLQFINYSKTGDESYIISGIIKSVFLTPLCIYVITMPFVFITRIIESKRALKRFRKILNQSYK